MGLRVCDKNVGTYQDYIWLSLSGPPIKSEGMLDRTIQSFYLDSPIKPALDYDRGSGKDALREMFYP